MKFKLKGIKKWKEKCEHFYAECLDYLDAFLVQGELTGLSIGKIEINEHNCDGSLWKITMPGGTMLQAEFILIKGDDEVKVRIFEIAFDINLTKEGELKELGFKYEEGQYEYSDGEKFITALLDMEKLKRLMNYLSGRWHYSSVG